MWLLHSLLFYFKDLSGNFFFLSASHRTATYGLDLSMELSEFYTFAKLVTINLVATATMSKSLLGAISWHVRRWTTSKARLARHHLNHFFFFWSDQTPQNLFLSCCCIATNHFENEKDVKMCFKSCHSHIRKLIVEIFAVICVTKGSLSLWLFHFTVEIKTRPRPSDPSNSNYEWITIPLQTTPFIGQIFTSESRWGHRPLDSPFLRRL